MKIEILEKHPVPSCVSDCGCWSYYQAGWLARYL